MPKAKGRISICRLNKKNLNTNIEERLSIANVDRDSEKYVTIYFAGRKGQVWYLILDQEAIETIRKV